MLPGSKNVFWEDGGHGKQSSEQGGVMDNMPLLLEEIRYPW